MSPSDTDDSCLSKRTRIVFCITELDPGGAEAALARLVLSLNREEWEPFVICLGPRGHYVGVLESADIPVRCLNAKGILSSPRVLFCLTRELRRLRPALVQTFLFHANILGRIASRLAGVRIVVSGLRVAEHRSLWYGRIDRWTNGLVATNVCVSQGVADFTERTVGLDRNKLVVIPNSVDVTRFANASPANLTEFGIPVGSRVFISIGRLDRQKGIDVLLAAVEELDRGGVSPVPSDDAAVVAGQSSVAAITLAKSIDDDVHFLIVGDGPEAHNLRDQVVRCKLSGRVHFANRRDDIPELLAASIALLLPSRWEGMPNVVLEAMAASRPVIATRVEGIAELVRNQVTGLVVSPENPVELASAIRLLLSEPQFKIDAGRESQHIVEQYFTQQSVTAAYVRIYQKLLALPIRNAAGFCDVGEH